MANDVNSFLQLRTPLDPKRFQIFVVQQGPFCGATDCPYFGLHVTRPTSFKARVVLSPVLSLA